MRIRIPAICSSTTPAGSSPSMKWVNPPVAYMLHAGVPLLMGAGLHLPSLHAGDASRVALDAPRTWQVGNASINRLLCSDAGFVLVAWADTIHLDVAAPGATADLAA